MVDLAAEAEKLCCERLGEIESLWNEYADSCCKHEADISNACEAFEKIRNKINASKYSKSLVSLIKELEEKGDDEFAVSFGDKKAARAAEGLVESVYYGIDSLDVMEIPDEANVMSSNGRQFGSFIFMGIACDYVRIRSYVKSKIADLESCLQKEKDYFTARAYDLLTDYDYKVSRLAGEAEAREVTDSLIGMEEYE